MSFGRNQLFKFAFILSGALAQLQHGSSYQISTKLGNSWSDQVHNVCADFVTGSILLQRDGCDSPVQGADWHAHRVGHPRSPQSFHIFATPQAADACGRFGCQITVKHRPLQGSTLRLGREASFFKIIRIIDDLYKIVLAANPTLHWTLQHEGDSVGAATIVLQEAAKNESLQTFKFVGEVQRSPILIIPDPDPAAREAEGV